MLEEEDINSEIEALFAQRNLAKQLGVNRKTWSSYKDYYRNNTLSLGKKLEILNLTGRLAWATTVEDVPEQEPEVNF